MKVITTFILGLFLTFCSDKPSVLEQIKQDGVLRVVSNKNLTTFYDSPIGSSGFEYDLVKRFANELGVDIELIFFDTDEEVLDALENHRGHLASAGLLVSPERKRRVRFGPSYLTVNNQLVYRMGNRKPRHLGDLDSRTLEIVHNSPESSFLHGQVDQYPELYWHENDNLDHQELLGLVSEKLVDMTIAKSNEVQLIRQFHPELRVAFDIGEEQHVSWAFPQRSDDSLYVTAIHFFNKLRRNGELKQLVDRHYGHTRRFDYIGMQRLWRHARLRLPQYKPAFLQAAEASGFDWRLLAAIGYQESHWNKRAVSPTGVRGIMMLTQATARQMGVKKRTDPTQSILGGARYLKHLIQRIPARIQEPDRLWFALAAYNVGLGHLEDARKITDGQGADPDKWIDVKERLPLLAQKKWYKKTRYGYARGWEPVRYVDNVRQYFDMLVWMEMQDHEHFDTLDTRRVTVDSPTL